MANPEHIKILLSGVDAWNAWRISNHRLRGDLSGAKLWGAQLRGANMVNTDLTGAVLVGANLIESRLSKSDLSGANLAEAVLIGASLIGVNLTEANLAAGYLSFTHFVNSDLSRANLTNARLNHSSFVNVNLAGAILDRCQIYGVSAWDVSIDEDTVQNGLVITPRGTPTVTVGSLEVAQLIYLLLRNERLSHVIDTITSKVVLLLGRFTSERKPMLDAIHDELKNRNYVPVLFDFSGPESRDVDETVSLLFRMARFVIVDLTDVRSAPQELKNIEALPSVPVQPLLSADGCEYGMFQHFKKYPWVLETFRYTDRDMVLESMEEVIGPAERMAGGVTSRDQ